MNTLRFSPESSATGVYDAFRTAVGVRQIKIKRVGGEEAVYELVQPLARSLYDTIRGCGVTRTYSRTASVDRWTSAYSGRQVSGDLVDRR